MQEPSQIQAADTLRQHLPVGHQSPSVHEKLTFDPVFKLEKQPICVMLP